jgi:hypothetical protein
MSTVTDEDLILKFRGLFPDKSRRELKNIFIDMTKSVYKNVGKDEKMTDVARNRWGAVAASLRSLNLIEFKIAMYRFKSAGLTFEEIRRVFIHLDTSGNGRVEYDEFLAGIRVSHRGYTPLSHNLLSHKVDGYLLPPILPLEPSDLNPKP